MKDLLFAILLGGLGAVLLFAGYRFARVLLALWGLIGGFMAGAAIFTDFTNDAFIATTLGIITGIVVGLLFAALAYLYYGVAVVLLTAGIGYAIGSSFITLFGIDPGFLSTTIGVIVGAAFGIAAVLFRVPKALLIVLTSFAGAITAIGGVLVLFNQVPLAYYDFSAARVVVTDSWLWSLVALALTGIGIVVQFMLDREYEPDEWMVGGDNTHHTPTTGMPTPTHA
ncbi:MAG: DUF4203 domain-containing protein [Candidatus Saccharimonadales bacterium]